MNDLEQIVKEYSSEKLIEVIENDFNAYSESFIDYAKDELIKRNVSFKYSDSLQDEIQVMPDDALKNLVENEWNNFHLEYIEIARKEYIKRGFKNETTINQPNTKIKIKEKYPALRGIISALQIFAWGYGIIFLILGFYFYSEVKDLKVSLSIVLMGLFIFMLFLGYSESIKIIIDIEKNTRKIKDK